jgi:hypothetical protein
MAMRGTNVRNMCGVFTKITPTHSYFTPALFTLGHFDETQSQSRMPGPHMNRSGDGKEMISWII